MNTELYELIMRIAELYKEADKETKIKVGLIMGGNYEQGNFNRQAHKRSRA